MYILGQAYVYVMCSVNYICANIPTGYMWGWTFVHTIVWMDVGAALHSITGLVRRGGSNHRYSILRNIYGQTNQDFTAVPHSTHSVSPGV